jgi:hypothetical protein
MQPVALVKISSNMPLLVLYLPLQTVKSLDYHKDLKGLANTRLSAAGLIENFFGRD